MKHLFLLTILFNFSVLYAQDLRTHIPYDADAVGSIDGSNVFETVTISELNRSDFGKMVLKELSKEFDYTFNTFDDLGINTKAITCFYYERTDSLQYFSVLIPLKETSFFDRIPEMEDATAIEKDNYKLISLGTGEFMAWDDNKVVFALGDVVHSYFDDYDFSEIEAALEANKEEEVVEEAVEVEETVAIEERVEELPEEMGFDDILLFDNHKLQAYIDDYHYLCEDIKKAVTYQDGKILNNMDADVKGLNKLVNRIDSINTSDSANLKKVVENKTFFVKEAVKKFENPENKERALKILKEATFRPAHFKVYEEKASNDYVNHHFEAKRALENRWLKTTIESIMFPKSKSILDNKPYAKQLDKKAIGNFWSNNFNNTLAELYSDLYAELDIPPQYLYSTFANYKAFTSNLYTKDEQMQVCAKLTLSDRFTDLYKNVTDHKFNRRFFRYINEDEMIGYMTYNVNFENVLKEYPKLIADSYASLLTDKVPKDELELGLELFSLLLDEEAVAEVIEGDALFVLNNISEKEVTYTGYDYNKEDYNYKEVEKTKTETLPDFLFMASTKKVELTKKLIDYLLKKKKIKEMNGYYMITEIDRSFPLQLYFTFKDDIFFISTSAAKITAIVNDNFNANLSRQHKKIMKRGAYNIYFDGGTFGKQFPVEKELNEKELMTAEYAIDNAPKFYLNSAGIRRNSLQGDFTIQFPDKNQHAIRYLLGFLDLLAKN